MTQEEQWWELLIYLDDKNYDMFEDELADFIAN